MADTARKPTILLGMINDAGIARIVAAALERHGFDVIDFSLDSLTFRYPNAAARLWTLWQKIRGNKEAKKELMVQLKRREAGSRLAAYPHIDYALFIRSDIYPESFLREIKARSGVMVNYQWDGVDRFAAARGQIGLFDRFYVFDPDDAVRLSGQVLPATSFYFDYPVDSVAADPEEIYFLGAHREDRKEAVVRFCRYAEQNGLKLNFQIARPGQPEADREYPVGNITFHNGIPYTDNLHNARSCGVLADFVISTHKGLSLRTFEAVGYRKKLITTNPQVAEYDFYHPDNIYIWNGRTFDGLPEFLAGPYHDLGQEITQKYSFGNWIRYVLQLAPYQALELPRPNTTEPHPSDYE